MRANSAKGPKRRRVRVVSVRLLPREAIELQEAAEKAGKSLSAFIREAAVREARPSLRIEPGQTVFLSTGTAT